MSGRNGLFAASVSSYLNEADQTYPTEDEVPVVAPKKIEEMAPAAPTTEHGPNRHRAGSNTTDCQHDTKA